MMKITSSTSMTSMSGIMLISPIGRAEVLRSKPRTSMSARTPRRGGGRLGGRRRRAILEVRTGAQKYKDIVRERFQPRQHHPVASQDHFVSEHRRHCGGKPERRHDERLADRTGHLVEGALAGHADVDQGVVHAPYRAEQTHERGG